MVRSGVVQDECDPVRQSLQNLTERFCVHRAASQRPVEHTDWADTKRQHVRDGPLAGLTDTTITQLSYQSHQLGAKWGDLHGELRYNSAMRSSLVRTFQIRILLLCLPGACKICILVHGIPNLICRPSAFYLDGLRTPIPKSRLFFSAKFVVVLLDR